MLLGSSLGTVAMAEETNDVVEQDNGTQILFENGIHYIIDPEYPDQKITLFCMNNKLHWPHHTEGMGDLQVPGYTEGYLTPEDFQSQSDYNECMRRLSKLLYAGYPYNGERLYQIVDDSSEYTPTEAEFNDMLVVPPVLQTAYPYLGHHDFTYADWETQNKEHLEYLREFTEEVVKLSINGGTTINGLTFKDISSMPFYKAVFSITNCNSGTPLTTFQFFYGASYFVTEEEAYNATQNAVWYLLHEYGIPNNDISSMSLPLSSVLYTYSEKGELLNYRPSSSEIEISGDLTFSYNPKDGMWHSSPLRIIEPEEYRGLYKLELPPGVTAQCDNLNYVYGNEEYELVSDHQPAFGEMFGIRAEFVWLEQFKQYSPSPDIEFEGKKFQHMIGAVIHNDTLYISKSMESKKAGNLAITKTVVGETNSQDEFQFELKLPYHPEINGLYGDLEFNNGVAQFTLKDGETKTAANLPAGAYYVVKESKTNGYETGSTNDRGKIPISDIQTITFTNTKLPDLTVTKIVKGLEGDYNKKFTFDIELKDKAGKPITGDYQYIGSVHPGHEHETTKPEDGTLTFLEGKAQIQLSHGQEIIIKDLPYESSYIVTEVEANQDGYNTFYDKGGDPAQGILNSDLSVLVENYKKPISELMLGNIKVEKIVTGSNGDVNKNFTFTVELSDKSINGSYGDVIFKDGVASFTLKHKENKVINGLPAGIKYTVTESDNAGYTVTSTGTVKANETMLVHFENYKSEYSGEQHNNGQINVKKVWKLDNGGKATNSVTVALMRDGKEFKTAELNEENNWEFTWENLNDNYEYSVKEINVPEGFAATTEQKGETVIITNDDNSIAPIVSNTGSSENPGTGNDTNIGLYVFLLSVSAVGIIIFAVLWKKNKT